MAQFDQAFKDEVRSRNDIVEVISSYVKLERRGDRYVGLCPFHGEKTPSFNVIPQLQIYHCFGCKASGDVFKFLMEREHLSFYEAMVQLARRARIPLPKEERTPEEERVYRERRALYDALDYAARFFQNQLFGEPGKPALDYLLGRGLTEETIRQFRLGWAPGYGRLFRAAAGRFDAEILRKAGLVLPRRDGTGFMDAFFSRVMFPITDLTGRVIGFGGRLIEGEGPKYKNTADTPLFTKRHVLFGLSQAKEIIRTRNQAILVEGYMDVITPYQAGVKNLVAPLGTALTEEQCKLLHQQAQQVIVAFDADTAGQMATLRGLELLYDTGCDVRILRIPDGKDPDEFIRTHGVEGFQRCIDEAMPLVEFKIRLALDRVPQREAGYITKAVDAVSRVLVDLKKDVLREEYANKVAGMLAPTAAEQGDIKKAIDRQMNRLLQQGFQHNQPNSRNNSRDLGFSGPEPLAPPAGKGASPPDPLTAKVTQDDLVWRAERQLIRLLLVHPVFLTRIQAALGSEPFADPINQTLYRAVAAVVAASGGAVGGPIAAPLLDTLQDSDARAVLTELAANPVVTGNPEQEATDCIEKIMEHRDSRRIADLENLMKAKQSAGQPYHAELQEYMQLQLKRKKPSKS